MSFDSRVLTYLNCYAKKFSKAGRARYRLLTGPGVCLPEDGEAGFTIEVGGKASDESRQHDVQVRFADRVLTADPPRLEIQPGDMVLWHAADYTVPGFTVRGESADGDFDSGSLEDQVVYSHAFGSPGQYQWVDANGGSASGVVEVVEPDTRDPSDCDKWVKTLSEGAVVHIAKGRIQPERVQIIPGQTVFWAVEKAPGITITDRRLLPPASTPPQEMKAKTRPAR